MTPDRRSPRSTSTRVREVLADELAGIASRHRIGSALGRLAPQGTAVRARSEVLRLTGWPIGTGCSFAAAPRLYGRGRVLRRLRVGDQVFVNVGGHWELNAPVTVGDGASIGHDVMILTTTHEMGDHSWRAGPLRAAPVSIGPGAWIGARCVLLPGVNVGAGAVVAANTVVRADVPDDVLYGGNPAGVIRPIDPE